MYVCMIWALLLQVVRLKVLETQLMAENGSSSTVVTFLLHLPPDIAFTAGDKGCEKAAGTNTPCFESLLPFLAHRSLAGLIWPKLTLPIDGPNQGPKVITWQGLFQQQGVMGSTCLDMCLWLATP